MYATWKLIRDISVVVNLKASSLPASVSILSTMLAALLLLPLALQVSAETYTLYHRFLPKGEYTPRGTVSIEDGVATFATEPVKAGQSESPWYQVALDVGGDMVTSSTRAVSALHSR